MGEDIARRSGSPTILPVQPVARSAVTVESPTNAVTNAAIKTERHWPTDAKHELMAKFFQSHSSATAAAAAASGERNINNHSTNKLTVNDPVSEILARLPPLDPSVALQWQQQQTEEVVQDDTQRHTETHRDTQRHTETYRDTQRHTETHRDTQRHTETHRDTQRYTETHSHTHRCARIVRRTPHITTPLH